MTYHTRNLRALLDEFSANKPENATAEDLAVFLNGKGAIAPKFNIYEKCQLLAQDKNLTTVFVKQICIPEPTSEYKYIVSESPCVITGAQRHTVPENRLIKDGKSISETVSDKADNLSAIKAAIESIDVSFDKMFDVTILTAKKLAIAGLYATSFAPGSAVYIIDKFNKEENRSIRLTEENEDSETELRIRKCFVVFAHHITRMSAPEYSVQPYEITENEVIDTECDLYWDRIFREEEVFSSQEEAQLFLENND